MAFFAIQLPLSFYGLTVSEKEKCKTIKTHFPTFTIYTVILTPPLFGVTTVQGDMHLEH